MKDSNFELRMGAKTWRLEDVEAPASGRVDGVDVLMLLLCEIMTASQEVYRDAWWFVIVTAKGKLTVLRCVKYEQFRRKMQTYGLIKPFMVKYYNMCILS